MKISITNSKLGTKIPALNLPALKTCRADAPCRKGCYALKGNWLYANVKNSLENNLNDFLNDSSKFFNDIIDYLNNGLTTHKYFRWFASGDIVNETFLNGMVEVAKKCKQTKFLCFTKKFEIVNNYLKNGGKIPNNLKIVFSAWTKDFKVDNPLLIYQWRISSLKRLKITLTFQRLRFLAVVVVKIVWLAGR